MPEPKRPLKVFLCHAHADRDAVRGLYARLRREGVDVWLDKEKLLPGADWEYEIRKAVREADVVVVCLSKQFNQAGFRQKEVRIALDTAMEKLEGEIFIIPARLEECDNLESLNRWHWVDLFEGDGFQRLILALRIRADKIGATLRLRRGGQATTPHPIKSDLDTPVKAEQEAAEKAGQEQAEREIAKKARLEAEELARQRAAKEKAGREAAERAAQEKAEKAAAEKARSEAKETLKQKTTKDRAQRESEKKVAREKPLISKSTKAAEGGQFLAGRYQILEKIGEGGVATVYKAFDSPLAREVSIKFIRTEHIPPSILEKSFERFKREATALARLQHPNIATVIDYGMQDGKPYLVMPYLPGGNLKQLMRTPMHWREAVLLLLPVSQALVYIHHQGIIHRDLKPSNILFTQSRQPILTDFGISMVLNLGNTDEFMVAGSVMGTPEYMAPELFTGKTVDFRADIYALGIILYEMITGRKPFIADTPMAVFIKQASEPLPRPQQFVRDLPDKVVKVLRKALEKDPKDRYGNMSAFVAAMQELLV